MIKSFTRIAVAGAAVATVFAGTASPALAAESGVLITDKTITLPDGRGKMIFHDDGDVFEACDTKADGYGVEGALVETTNQGTVLYVTDGGDSGCDKAGYDISWTRSYYMQLSWNGGGQTVSSAHFSE